MQGVDFDADAFRDGIRQAMTLAFPNAKTDRPLFRFATNPEYDAADSGNVPFDWTDTPTETVKRPRRVLCIIDTHDKPMPLETPIGPFRMDQPDLYFFEDEWSRVHDFVSVDIYGRNYKRIETLIPITLGTVTLQHVRVKVEDVA